ncbi:inhibitor of nuclear factor kappa B kinase subunit beta isoform 1-T1 [Glossina fuscipes fuscipes]
MNELVSCLNWDPVKCLGQGGFGRVMLWKHRQTGQEIATKFLKIKNLAPDEEEKLKERWMQEYQWQQQLEIPYIVKAVKLQDTDFMKFLNKFHSKIDSLPVIIMEYCNGGDLRNYLARIEHLNGLFEYDIRQVLYSLRNAIHYLHQHCKVQHRDLKPENIIIHLDEGGKGRHYKLADFGYTRCIPEHTKLQSVVGTPEYVAPEVIRGARYNETVDYWSIGVIAFEMLCGIRPFLPHCEFYRIIETIQKKPQYCIAIKENFDTKIVPKRDGDEFIFVESIFPENNSTFVFAKKLEAWLRLALDSNYKSRGHIGNELKFYTELDAILSSKVVTVYCLTSYQFFSFEVTPSMPTEWFLNTLCHETKIEARNLYMILPLIHPKNSLDNISIAMDFYVEDWIRREPENPLAMLYVMDVRQCDCNVKCPKFSPTIMDCMELCAENCNSLSKGLLEEFELHTHFVISDEQRHLEAYLEGLQCYAVEVEHHLLSLKPQINNLRDQLLITQGRIQQFSLTVDELNKRIISNDSQQIWLKKIETYYEEVKELQAKFWETMKVNFQRICTSCKNHATEQIYENLSKNDIYKLQEYRRSFREDDKNSDRLLKSQYALDNLSMRKQKIQKDPLLKEIRKSLKSSVEFYQKVTHDIYNDIQYLNKMNNSLDNDCKEILQFHCLEPSMPSLYGNSSNEILTDAHNILDEVISYMNVTKMNENIE